MICTGPPGDDRVCTIYSPNVTTNGALMEISSGTQNVILYCVCRIDDVAVGPTTWFIGNTAVTRTTASGDNPYYRDNVPSPLIIPLFTAALSGVYGCGSGGGVSTPGATINLVGMHNLTVVAKLYCDISVLSISCIKSS